MSENRWQGFNIGELADLLNGTRHVDHEGNESTRRLFSELSYEFLDRWMDGEVKSTIPISGTGLDKCQ